MTVAALLTELHHSDYIIKTILRAMTVQQQARVGAELERAGIAGEGMTRHHERAAVIAAATAVPATVPTSASPAPHLLDIEAQAVDVLTQAEHADVLLQAVFDKLDQMERSTPAAVAINCFATCAARAVALMREAAENIIGSLKDGGAA
ncbi:hypothetical protein E4L98_29185 [Duganella callida]|uniref:Uncharacterized protein n=2 Tax=Duganella callida TaxID=2561932 RepID=A0A4Y9S152_9BURK|nr:hypothetical protein E4L98_29185 [Duganella callida]